MLPAPTALLSAPPAGSGTVAPVGPVVGAEALAIPGLPADGVLIFTGPRPAPPVVAISAAEVDEADAAEELGSWLASMGVERPFVVASERCRALSAGIRGRVGHAAPPLGATQDSARALGAQARLAGADVIVAVGGGRCLDVAKLAAFAAGLRCAAVPTQLSHDGTCSPVAVLPAVRGGVGVSARAAAPEWAFFARPTLARSPIASLLAGVGDLLSNPLALRDWRLAAEHGHEHVDVDAWHVSAESFLLVEPMLTGVLDDLTSRAGRLGGGSPAGSAALEPWVVGRLAHALAASGFAMLLAGSSRPASGAEHKLSHAIDARFGGRALHGAQVAFASVMSADLHGVDPDGLVDILRRLGLPHHPRMLGLSADDLVEVVLAAPATRLGRFTALEAADLSRRGAARLVRRIWPGA